MKGDNLSTKPQLKVEKSGGERIRAFRGNDFSVYHEHAVSEFPLPSRIFRALILGLILVLAKIVLPWKIEDAHKLFDDKRARVLIMNHAAALDPLFVVVPLWAHGITVRPIYKSEFERIKPLDWLLTRLGGIPVDRGTADMSVIRRSEAALKRGESIIIFPEGTRVRSYKEQVEVHGGFALIARRGKAPVQPLAIVGSRDIVSDKTHLVRPFNRIYIKAGDCISFDDLGVSGRKAQSKAMERLAMERVYSMRTELRKIYPHKH